MIMSEWVSEWVIGVLSRSWQFCSLVVTGARFTKLNGLIGLWTESCHCVLVVCMCWTCIALVRPAASLYSASPLKHHTTGRQWCLNPGHFPDTEPASRFLTPLRWALSRAAEPQILMFSVWRDRGSNHQPPTFQANAQPLHYLAAVIIIMNRNSAEKYYSSGIHVSLYKFQCHWTSL